MIALNTSDPRYGSMLSEIIKRIMAGMSLSDVWAFILQYIKDHYLPKPAPVVASAGPDDLAWLKGMIEGAVGNYQKHTGQPISATIPEAIDYIITLIRSIIAGGVVDWKRELQLAAINTALQVVIPALQAQGTWGPFLAGPLKILLEYMKEQLETVTT